MFVLYQIANEKTSIRSADGCAYVRVLGLFKDRKKAMQHIEIVGDEYEIRIAPVGQWKVLLNRSMNDPDFHEAEATKYEKLLEMHTMTQEAKDQAVKKAFEEKQPGELRIESMFERKAVDAAVPKTKQQTVPKISGQDYAVIAIVPDYENKIAYEAKLGSLVPSAERAYIAARNNLAHTNISEAKDLDKAEFMDNWSKDQDTTELPGDEPLVQFLRTFHTEEEAKEFLQKDASLKEYSKACIEMYQFVRLRDLDKMQIMRYYQDPEQQVLMDAFRKALK